ncbi:MAG: hypothetical protein QM589_17240 [Thermomicrobiales bacterium]
MKLNMLDADDNRTALAEIAQTAIDAFRQCRDLQDPQIYGDLTVGAHAKQVFDVFCRLAQRRFSEHPRIQVYQTNQLTFLGLGDINIRLRKSSRGGLRIARNATVSTGQWTSADLATLPGFDHATLQLILAYSPDRIWMDIERMALGLYRGDMPISYRELDLSMLSAEGINRWDSASAEQSFPPIAPLEFTDSVDSPRLDEEFG